MQAFVNSRNTCSQHRHIFKASFKAVFTYFRKFLWLSLEYYYTMTCYLQIVPFSLSLFVFGSYLVEGWACLAAAL